jgi:putative ABC transport system permease protein
VKIARSIRLSSRQLLAHKLRTALSLVGITIGVGTVVLMVAIGNGAQQKVLAKIQSLGTDLLIVSAGQVQKISGRQAVRGTVTTLIPDDGAAILRECSAVKAVAPVQSRKLLVKAGNLATNTSVIGTVPEFRTIRNFRVTRGSFFSDEENAAVRRVAVLGLTVVRNLFEGQDPIGELVHIGKVPFEVIGVLEAKGTDLAGVDQDDQILIPVQTALRRLFNVTYVSSLYLQAVRTESMGVATTQIRGVLRDRHRLSRQDRPDDFTIQNQTELLATQRATTGSFTTLIASIAAISLLVGGIGILAVMLIAIRERTNEIGLRRAVGATRKDIMVQFVLEAVMLSLGGGVLGVALGAAGALGVRLVTSWATSISLPSILIALGFSLLVGLFFGVYPARRASRLDPIEALRSE